MSEFLPPPVPLVTPEEARDRGRSLQAIADYLRGTGEMGLAREVEGRAMWWVTYAIALAHTKRDGEGAGT